ncbi:hypothetical protein, partial [Escherichia coli]|uniref:hypothetical protein n=1 Tax=Escherichia coli TaxID=562 RepID=UPI00197F6AED
MGSCAAPSAKGDDKFITTDYLQQCQSANILNRTTIGNLTNYPSTRLNLNKIPSAKPGAVHFFDEKN